jgi:hypothetical protein
MMPVWHFSSSDAVSIVFFFQQSQPSKWRWKKPKEMVTMTEAKKCSLYTRIGLKGGWEMKVWWELYAVFPRVFMIFLILKYYLCIRISGCVDRLDFSQIAHFPFNYPGDLLQSQTSLFCQHRHIDPTALCQYRVITKEQYYIILTSLVQEVTEHRHRLGTGLYGCPEAKVNEDNIKGVISHRIRAHLLTVSIENIRHWCAECVQQMLTLKKVTFLYFRFSCVKQKFSLFSFTFLSLISPPNFMQSVEELKAQLESHVIDVDEQGSKKFRF